MPEGGAVPGVSVAQAGADAAGREAIGKRLAGVGRRKPLPWAKVDEQLRTRVGRPWPEPAGERVMILIEADVILIE